jgi:4-amino-4-deoxy-L-arabinose transferase-like glycosyltransferase
MSFSAARIYPFSLIKAKFSGYYMKKFVYLLVKKIFGTSEIDFNLEPTRRRAALFFAILASFYFIVFGITADLKNTASFGGDTWEYQSMAVNFAKGYGIQKFGGLEAFDTYKFEHLTTLPPYYNDFFARAGNYDFVRTPAYPLFLGIVYKLFGINPAVAKVLQLLMLVVIAASLPFIGYQYWGTSGFVSGIPAGALYLATNYKLAEHILTESLIAFSVFLILVAFILYEEQEETFTACLLGGFLGFALLVKGSLVFLPILTYGVVLISAIIKRDPGKLKLLFAMTISTAIVVLPWSIYASTKTGRFIFLSIQGSTAILDDNNEFCVDGGWHPEWVNNKTAMYNTDGIDKKHALEKVINFYWHNPMLLPRCMSQKFLKGFGPFLSLWVFVGLMLFNGVCRFLGRFPKLEFAKRLVGNSAMQIPVSFWVVGGNFLLITLLFHAEALIVRSRHVAPMDFVFALLCCVSVVRLFSNISTK